jgi:glutamate-1-semialdehyde 2,1-aminomutase
MRRDGWWWTDGALTNKSIKRGILRELISHRLRAF